MHFSDWLCIFQGSRFRFSITDFPVSGYQAGSNSLSLKMNVAGLVYISMVRELAVRGEDGLWLDAIGPGIIAESCRACGKN